MKKDREMRRGRLHCWHKVKNTEHLFKCCKCGVTKARVRAGKTLKKPVEKPPKRRTIQK